MMHWKIYDLMKEIKDTSKETSFSWTGRINIGKSDYFYQTVWRRSANQEKM